MRLVHCNDVSLLMKKDLTRCDAMHTTDDLISHLLFLSRRIFVNVAIATALPNAKAKQGIEKSEKKNLVTLPSHSI